MTWLLKAIFRKLAQTQKALDFIAQQNWKTDEVLLVGHSAGAHLEHYV